jgi:hypothetical protein
MSEKPRGDVVFETRRLAIATHERGDEMQQALPVRGACAWMLANTLSRTKRFFGVSRFWPRGDGR